ncbi:MAG: sulfotransferase [Acidimicrobiales bacterium]|nr:sulfotransferase [Acidimicrobiales bacterium]
MGDSEIAAMASMAERYTRPDWVRRINAMGDSVGGARHIVPLDAGEILASATSALGGPFGDFDQPGWESAFEELVAVLDVAPMNVLGRLMTRQELTRCLRTRLLLSQHWAANPSLAGQQVVAPLVITGPARSGTSILFELLSLDPALHAPPTWEIMHPLLAPDIEHDDRPVFGQCESELWTDIQPELAALHEWRADLPAECITLTAPSFVSPHWGMICDGGTPSDAVENYAFHKRVLQTMQADEPDRTWLLKTPAHLMTIDLLFATYPDAWVVQTHRDPAKTMPSTVSMTAGVKWMRGDEVDLRSLAAQIRMGFAWALTSVADRRATGDLPERFVDVRFRSLVDDPVEAVRRAYGVMERDFTADFAHSIERYMREKPQGKFGHHRYTPEAWGYTAAELREDLASYIDAFSIELEDHV